VEVVGEVIVVVVWCGVMWWWWCGCGGVWWWWWWLGMSKWARFDIPSGGVVRWS